MKIISGLEYFFKSTISSACANSSASLSLIGFLPATITLAPFNLQRRANIKPIGPMPIIPTLSPALIPVLSTPCTTLASGSEKAAFSKGRLGGKIKVFFFTILSGTTIYSAYAPFNKFKFSQRLYSPRLQ